MNNNKNKAAQLKNLRGIGHKLDPIVMVGASGVGQNLIDETIRALTDHELIKIKVPAGDSNARKEICQTLANATGSQVVHHIGRMALLYKPNPNANPKLSNITRFDY